MSSFKMRTQEQDETRVGVVGRRAIETMPESVPGACAGRTDIGVTVVAVNAPGMQHPLVVDYLVSGAPHVVKDLVVTALLESAANPHGQIV